MTKIKVVQIAYTGNHPRTQYLDDKGRVWVDEGHLVDHYERSEYAHPSNVTRVWKSDWKQIELPDEPDEKEY